MTRNAAIVVFNILFAGFMIWSVTQELHKCSPALGIKAVIEVCR